MRLKEKDTKSNFVEFYISVCSLEAVVAGALPRFLVEVKYNHSSGMEAGKYFLASAESEV